MTIKNQHGLALEATREALRVRTLAGLQLLDPVPCIYDLVQNMGIEVRFLDVPSMEGMYSKDPLVIVVSAFRPPGRQAFTCAHELAHHHFGHGLRIDELVDQSPDNPQEFIADRFAGALLMPKTLVNNAFTIRGWTLQRCSPLQIYTIANWLGVGYSTLVKHMRFTFDFLSQSQAEALEKVSPKKIRAEILGRDLEENLVIVDPFWCGRPIDVQVGDVIHLPKFVATEKHGSSYCVQLLAEYDDHILLRAVAPGLARLFDPAGEWGAFIRVMHRNYIGRSIFRHLEDSDV